MKTYDIDLFYELSPFFKDDLRLMAHAVAYALNLNAKTIYKDFSFGRYKDEYLKALLDVSDNPKEAYLNLLMKFRDKSPIFDRDDFANAEAYSVFNRSYGKKRTDERRKNV